MEDKRKMESYVGYEYKSITVKKEYENLYIDSLINFGWKLEEIKPSIKGITSVTLKLKRDRKIRNKVEITRLERQFESSLKELMSLEMSKSTYASTAAYVIGVVGTALMAGSVFGYLAGNIILCIVLAIPAFIFWIIPYFCFTKLKNKKTDEVMPLIDQHYEMIYETCEKANNLINN